MPIIVGGMQLEDKSEQTKAMLRGLQDSTVATYVAESLMQYGQGEPKAVIAMLYNIIRYLTAYENITNDVEDILQSLSEYHEGAMAIEGQLEAEGKTRQ